MRCWKEVGRVRTIVPGLLLGGEACGDLSGDCVGLCDTEMGADAVVLSDWALSLWVESPCSSCEGGCGDGGGWEVGGGGGGVTLGKREERNPGRNWSILVHVMLHSFAESTSWRRSKVGGVMATPKKPRQ